MGHRCQWDFQNIGSWDRSLASHKIYLSIHLAVYLSLHLSTYSSSYDLLLTIYLLILTIFLFSQINLPIYRIIRNRFLQFGYLGVGSENFVLFQYIRDFIIPTDFHIFQTGWYTTSKIYLISYIIYIMFSIDYPYTNHIYINHMYTVNFSARRYINYIQIPSIHILSIYIYIHTMLINHVSFKSPWLLLWLGLSKLSQTGGDGASSLSGLFGGGGTLVGRGSHNGKASKSPVV